VDGGVPLRVRMPVQAPAKCEIAINLETAKAKLISSV
jgi:hypothetical protein